MQTPRLIFHPKDPQQLIAMDSLQKAMREIGFIGDEMITHGDNCFAAGEHFIELLSFLGCSPVINLSAGDGDKFCYIEIIQRPVAELVFGSQPFQPRCRQCRQPIADWEQQYKLSSTICCHECGNRMEPQLVNWKQSAGYASQFMLIHNIYLHEAVPGELLLSSLAKLSSEHEWTYFYAL
ncbi:MAG: hypothetical protein OEX03_08090 [Gammaproteobacteria bacterium]|nr:hypothetical protein [Gammaproteobacteria bacterium]